MCVRSYSHIRWNATTICFAIEFPNLLAVTPVGAIGSQGRGARAPTAAVAASLEGRDQRRWKLPTQIGTLRKLRNTLNCMYFYSIYSCVRVHVISETDVMLPGGHENDFDRIRRLVPLTAVLARYRFSDEFKRTDSQLVGRCPIHNGSNRRQFVVNPKTGLWHCFGDCNRGGGALELVAEIERLDMRGAAKLIAEWFAIPMTPRARSRSSSKPGVRAMSGSRPSHKAFVVEDKDPDDGSDEKPFWTRVGSAWPNKDGHGYNIVIAPGIAVSGRIVLREYTDDDVKKEEDAKAKYRKR